MKSIKKTLLATILGASVLALTGCNDTSQDAQNKSEQYEGKFVCESEYVAYVTDNNEIQIAYQDGTTAVVKDVNNVTKISGGESELIALDKDGNIIFCSVKDAKRIDNVSDYFEIDTADFELGGTMLAIDKAWNEGLAACDNIKKIIMDCSDEKKYYYAEDNANNIMCDGCNWPDAVKSECTNWNELSDFTSNGQDALGLKDNGDIVTTSTDVKDDIESWTDITDIESGFHFFGLKKDGTVLSSAYEPECLVSDWEDITQLSAAVNTTVGLKSDGTVNVACAIETNQADATQWENIVYVKAAYDYVLGVKENGEIITTPLQEGGFNFDE